MTTITSSTGTYQIRSVTFQAPSRSRDGKTHTVSMDWATRTAAGCSCEQWTYRHTFCRHMADAEAGKLGKPHIRYHQVAGPRPAEWYKLAHKAITDLYGD